MANRTLQRLQSRVWRVAVERFGARIDDTWILVVPGRRTGIPRHVPVKLLDVDGSSYLVALRGDTDWPRNLRAAGTSARLHRRGQVVPITAAELPPDERPRILRAYLAAATRGTTLDILGGGRRDPDQAHLRRIAADHPVFRLTFPVKQPFARSPRTAPVRYDAAALPADVHRLVRVVERWGLLAGATGVAANVLLVVLYVLALPGRGDYAWTGPANDVIGGIVSTGATIPVAIALGKLVGDLPAVRRTTIAAVVAMASIVVSSVLLVTDVIPFELQVFVAIPAVVLMLGWMVVIGRAGLAARALPPRLARFAVVIGVAGCLGMGLVGASALLPWQSVGQYVVGGAGLLVGLPAFLALPIWLIVLSSRLRAHFTETDDARTELVDHFAGTEGAS